MDKAKLQELAIEFAKGIKTQHDLNDFTKMLTKMAVETALNAELTDHLGYEKHQSSPEGGTNARNGSTKKRLKGIMVTLKLSLQETVMVALSLNYSLSIKVVSRKWMIKF